MNEKDYKLPNTAPPPERQDDPPCNHEKGFDALWVKSTDAPAR